MARTTTMDVAGGGPFVDVDGDTHLNANDLFVEGALVRLGAPSVVTILSGVATITTGFVALAAESGTTDQLDTLTLAGAGAGDIVLLVPDPGDTITVDDANIDLGAATRVMAPGGCLALRYDGTSWGELFFLAAADNV
jgi:hypothetical protein